MILGGLEYAAKIGIQPHRDWSSSNNIIEPNKPFENKFTFGRDGKPFYVAGPYDKGTSSTLYEKNHCCRRPLYRSRRLHL